MAKARLEVILSRTIEGEPIGEKIKKIQSNLNKPKKNNIKKIKKL